MSTDSTPFPNGGPADPVWFDGPLAGHAVEVAPRIWWVGNVVPDDPFQMHAYLIEAGSRSVLVDPGSSLTIGGTLAKIQEVVDLDDVSTILLHHSDPDCADAVHRLGDVLGDHVRIVTEWRSELLLRHLTPRFPIVTIEDLDWRLELEPGRELQFLLTPYLHFPGAFVSYDTSTGALLTADLFGGFNNARRLWATSTDDFEDLRTFHEHYMPSREILMSGLATIRSRFRSPSMLLPQHGYVIPRPLVNGMFDELFGLDCGVMLMSRSDTHLALLVDAAATARRVEDLLRSDLELVELLRTITETASKVLPIDALAVERCEADGSFRRYDVDHPEGVTITAPSTASDRSWVLPLTDEPDCPLLVAELSASGADLPAEILEMFAMLLPEARPVVERLLDLHVALQEGAAWRHTATHDPLTGLESRRTLDLDATTDGPTAVLMLDLDEFKQVNDTWGHPVGDEILQQVADAVRRSVRPGDRAVRYGGEELTVLAPLDGHDHPAAAARELAERLRRAVEMIDTSDLTPGRSLTISVGVAVGHDGERLEAIVERADDALYAAKRNGRNRVEVAADELLDPQPVGGPPG